MVRIPRLLVIVACLLLVFGLSGCAGNDTTSHPLEGRWILESVDGKKIDSASAPLGIEFSQGHLYQIDNGEKVDASRVSYGWYNPVGWFASEDEACTYFVPRRGEIDISRKGETRRGIYSINSGELTLAVLEKNKGEARPTDFIPRNTFEHRVMVMKLRREVAK